ncbi:hypothetical protein Vretimale_17505 [Volvox reticuliferus]|uniref:Sulfite exporter TauE/SafE family protein n=1 Tax=Volvox reticuliferus TaxID=1737510 RepID=A0A8J4FVB4_9CHLO|nr:hypothetical protein Vretifemale_18187 [Volvox reticuliferus]GIM14612.1 hypothetical protein Vretimale_17505 [Volvox reticuliferus]
MTHTVQEDLNDQSPFVANGRTLVSLGIVVLVGAVASSSGVGGGAIFIPLLNVLVGFNLKSSTSLSQACITCGAAAALLANLMHHHPSDPRVALVDFTLVAILTPILLMGVGIGVMLNVMLPSELLLGLLLLLLALLIGQTINKGRALWLQENALRCQLQLQHLEHRPGQESAVSLERSSSRQRGGERRRRRRRLPDGGGGCSTGDDGDGDGGLREPLLGDGRGGVSSSSPPPPLSPGRCLTPAPTAIWHLNELDEASAGAGEEGAVPAAVLALTVGGVAHDAFTEDQMAAAAVEWRCAERADYQIIGIGGGGCDGSSWATRAAEAVAVAIVSGAPAGPEDLIDNDGGGGGGSGGAAGLLADSLSPAAAAVVDDVKGAPVSVTSWQQQQQLAHGSSMTHGPTAAYKSPFLRQTVPRSATQIDDTLVATVTATAATCSTTTNATAANATAMEHHIVNVKTATLPAGSSTAPASSVIRPRAAVAAAPLSPEAVATFAEALAAALAADAASSPGTTWSSSSWLGAATSSLFALSAPPWRAFNELGVVDHDDDDDTDGDGEAEVYDTRNVNAYEQYDVHSPSCHEYDCEAGKSTEADGGAARSSVHHQPLVSVVVNSDVDEGASGAGGGAGGGIFRYTCFPQPQPQPQRRLKGLPGLQLSGSGRRLGNLPRPHSAVTAATAGRKSLGEGGHTPALAAVAAAAAVTFLVKEGAGCGGAARLALAVPPLDTPERREGSRPGVEGSPPEGGAAPQPQPPSLQGPSNCDSLCSGLYGVAGVHGPEQEAPVAVAEETAVLQPPPQPLSGVGSLRSGRSHLTSDAGEQAPMNGAAAATAVSVGVVRVTSVTGPAAAASHPGPQLRDQGSKSATEGGLFASHLAALRRIPLVPVVALAVAWGVYFGLQFLRSRVLRCSPLWWALAGGQALGMFGLSLGALLVAATPAAASANPSAAVAASTTLPKGAGAAAAAAVLSSAKPSLPRDWPRQQLAVVLRAPVAVLAATCGAGLAGGLLGLGGGMVMGPLLLHLGLHPQVTAATSGAMVLFSSSAALAQFALMGRLNTAYAVVFGAASAAASVVGSQLLSRAVKRSGRPSVVVLALAAVLASGAACVAASGLRTALGEDDDGGGKPGGLAALCGRQ